MQNEQVSIISVKTPPLVKGTNMRYGMLVSVVRMSPHHSFVIGVIEGLLLKNVQLQVK